MSEHNGSGLFYKVEVRLRFPNIGPRVIGPDFIVDGTWRGVPTVNGLPGGVVNTTWDRLATEAGLLTYEAAMAIAWMTLAVHPMNLEARLVQFKHEYTSKSTQLGPLEAFVVPMGREVKPVEIAAP